MSITKQATFWGVTSFLLLAFVWIFKSVLMPFVLGMVIAYLLNPLVHRFSTKGVKRTTSSAFIITIFFLIVTAVIVIVAPIVAKESAELLKSLPDYLDKIFNLMQPYMGWVHENLGQDYMIEAKSFLKDNVSKILTFSGGLANGLAAGGQAVAGVITTIVLTPLVAFYMMKEWPLITNWVEGIIPRHNEKMIKDLLKEIDQKLSGFIRGQLTVAFLLGIIYAVALTLAGLNYGFLIGVSAGVLSIIPMVGSTLGLLVAVAVAWFQAGEVQYVLIIAAIFIVGQIIEGNILSPKLLGKSVGLHPLWILFALMAGGSLFGILGMLLAVPVAAVVGVLASFAIMQYQKSPLYKKVAPKKTTTKTAAKKTTKKTTKASSKKSVKKKAEK